VQSRQSPERERTSKSLPTELVRIGQIVGSFGLRGQVKISPSTDFWDRFAAGQTVYLNDSQYLIVKSAVQKGRPLLKLKGVDSIEEAEALKWAELYATGTPELEEDEYLVNDLIGLEVVTDAGTSLGKIEQILPYPAHDILVVGEVMIPMIKEFVLAVDPDANTVTVHLIPGMVSD
jgi:16S rRNA processing protein RimM